MLMGSSSFSSKDTRLAWVLSVALLLLLLLLRAQIAVRCTLQVIFIACVINFQLQETQTMLLRAPTYLLFSSNRNDSKYERIREASSLNQCKLILMKGL